LQRSHELQGSLGLPVMASVPAKTKHGIAFKLFKIQEKHGRGGRESEYAVALKIHKLLKKRVAQNAQNAEIGPNWNVSGTWKFRLPATFCW
jgi:hypothetical protein